MNSRVGGSPSLAEALFDLLVERRQECLAKGWKQVPALIFCSETGSPWQERNFNRVWERVRRKAQAEGARPLRLHCTRHTYASRALAAGKSLRWVAGQLGHSNPELTLRQYAHMLPQEETDLSFADFGGSKRQYTAVAGSPDAPNENTPGLNDRGHWEKMERETGLEPATLSLGSQPKGKK